MYKILTILFYCKTLFFIKQNQFKLHSTNPSHHYHHHHRRCRHYYNSITSLLRKNKNQILNSKHEMKNQTSHHVQTTSHINVTHIHGEQQIGVSSQNATLSRNNFFFCI